MLLYAVCAISVMRSFFFPIAHCRCSLLTPFLLLFYFVIDSEIVESSIKISTPSTDIQSCEQQPVCSQNLFHPNLPT